MSFRQSLLLALALATPCSAAADDFAIDLAHDGDTTRPVPAGVELRLTLVNTVPIVKYTVLIERVSIPIDPFSDKAIRTAESGREESVCPKLVTATDTLRNEDHGEKKVSEVKSNLLTNLIPKAIAEECEQEVIDQATDAVATTTRELGTFILAEGEELRVTVTRDIQPKGTKTWKAVFSTGARGSWIVSYGFAYASDHDEPFFAQATGTGKFKIVEEVDRREFAALPTVFFSWLPRKHELTDLSPSLAGGLGFDQSAPTVCLGGSLAFNRNLMFVAGGSMRRQLRLRGQYKGTGDEEVAENLTREQLHEHTYRPGLFFALTFRFDNNPFKKDAPAKPKDAAKDAETPKDDKKAGEKGQDPAKEKQAPVKDNEAERPKVTQP